LYVVEMTSGPASAKDFDQPKLEALVEMMYLAAYADGEFSDEERSHFVRSIESLTDKRLAGEALAKVLERIERDAHGERAERLAAVKARLGSPAACMVAFRMAVEVMMADGIIRTSERELILDIADALDLDRDEAADIVKEYSE
jgi:tellurite resistance protein